MDAAVLLNLIVRKQSNVKLYESIIFLLFDTTICKLWGMENAFFLKCYNDHLLNEGTETDIA